jgi:hypothetical protein
MRLTQRRGRAARVATVLAASAIAVASTVVASPATAAVLDGGELITDFADVETNRVSEEFWLQGDGTHAYFERFLDEDDDGEPDGNLEIWATDGVDAWVVGYSAPREERLHAFPPSEVETTVAWWNGDLYYAGIGEGVPGLWRITPTGVVVIEPTEDGEGIDGVIAALIPAGDRLYVWEEFGEWSVVGGWWRFEGFHRLWWYDGSEFRVHRVWDYIGAVAATSDGGVLWASTSIATRPAFRRRSSCWPRSGRSTTGRSWAT